MRPGKKHPQTSVSIPSDEASFAYAQAPAFFGESCIWVNERAGAETTYAALLGWDFQKERDSDPIGFGKSFDYDRCRKACSCLDDM